MVIWQTLTKAAQPFVDVVITANMSSKLVRTKIGHLQYVLID